MKSVNKKKKKNIQIKILLQNKKKNMSTKLCMICPLWLVITPLNVKRSSNFKVNSSKSLPLTSIQSCSLCFSTNIIFYSLNFEYHSPNPYFNNLKYKVYICYYYRMYQLRYNCVCVLSRTIHSPSLAGYWILIVCTELSAAINRV